MNEFHNAMIKIWDLNITWVKSVKLILLKVVLGVRPKIELYWQSWKISINLDQHLHTLTKRKMPGSWNKIHADPCLVLNQDKSTDKMIKSNGKKFQGLAIKILRLHRETICARFEVWKIEMSATKTATQTQCTPLLSASCNRTSTLKN